MCGRYSLFVDPGALEQRFDITISDYEPRYNAAPGEQLPVITDDSPERLSAVGGG